MNDMNDMNDVLATPDESVAGKVDGEAPAEKPGKKKRHKRNKKDIFIGMLLVLIPLFALLGGAGWFLSSHNLYLSLSNQNAVNATNKLSTIQALIDQYFLFDYKQEDLNDNSIKGYVSGLGDPYSAYYTKEEFDKLKESNSGTYYGIGVLMNQSKETGIITAVKVFRNSPALEAGIEPGDMLIAVDGEEVTGMDLNNVVSLIKGKEGSTVKITIGRDGGKNIFDLDVERREVDVETVSYKMLDQKIGYIELSEFDDVSTEQFKEGLDELKGQGMESLIVDLRDNPGGLLDTALKLADMFIDTGIVITTEDSKGNTKDYNATESGSLGIPCVVLVNENSASASEVLSGCLKHYGVVTLVGQKTFGKGIVQNIIPLGDGTALKLTIAHYYLPDGTDIHKEGITPDVTVEDDPETPEDEQLQKGIEILTEKQ